MRAKALKQSDDYLADGDDQTRDAGGGAPTPAHVAIIMDGNGRWAAARGRPRAFGHRAGVEALRRTVRAAGDAGVAHLTLYSFSTENWRRPQSEIRELMTLLRLYVESDLQQLRRERIRVRVIGDRENIGSDLRAIVERCERETAEGGERTLTIAFNYGGRDEIARAAKRIAQAAKAGLIEPDAIDEEMISTTLDTAGAPDPDLVIRTSGEHRVSNFLLWQAAYAEYIFLDVLWPDFDAEHLNAALAEFRRRDRRYGGVTAAAE